MSRRLAQLKEKLTARRASVAVVGLGYVGLPVAVSFAHAGFRVVGIDTDPSRVDSVMGGRSFLVDVPDERLAPLVAEERLSATTSYESVREAHVVLICVPTPITDGAPDVSHILAAGREVGRYLERGSLVILESTSYPGTTEDLLRPLLEEGGSIAGRDFFLAYSPERIDPGNPNFGFEDIPKVVGGIDETSTEAATALYGQLVTKVFAVSSPREAELAKLVENTFRHVNIALVNELTVYAHELGIDIWEAIDAAATKPFGFMPFYPGPGWGGHCIPLDPAFLSWLVKRDRAHEVRFVELAHAVNAEMPRYVVERASLLLNEQGRAVQGAKILCVGAAYKAGTDDTRGAGALKVMTLLAKRGAEVSYHDPLVRETVALGRKLRSTRLTKKKLGEQDLVITLVRHPDVNWDMVASEAPLVFDCCNALRGTGGKIARL